MIYPVSDPDASCEAEIKAHMHAYAEAAARKDMKLAQHHWRMARDLIKTRSPRQVNRMETERGLGRRLDED